jgi:hypothetical protein
MWTKYWSEGPSRAEDHMEIRAVIEELKSVPLVASSANGEATR